MCPVHCACAATRRSWHKSPKFELNTCKQSGSAPCPRVPRRALRAGLDLGERAGQARLVLGRLVGVRTHALARARCARGARRRAPHEPKKGEPPCEHGEFQLLADFFPRLPPPDPAVRPFSPGVGWKWFVRGTKVFESETGWTDVDKAGSIGDLVFPRPTLAWEDENGDREEAFPAATADLSMDDAWLGGSWLVVSVFAPGSDSDDAFFRSSLSGSARLILSFRTVAQASALIATSASYDLVSLGGGRRSHRRRKVDLLLRLDDRLGPPVRVDTHARMVLPWSRVPRLDLRPAHLDLTSHVEPWSPFTSSTYPKYPCLTGASAAVLSCSCLRVRRSGACKRDSTRESTVERYTACALGTRMRWMASALTSGRCASLLRGTGATAGLSDMVVRWYEPRSHGTPLAAKKERSEPVFVPLANCSAARTVHEGPAVGFGCVVPSTPSEMLYRHEEGVRLVARAGWTKERGIWVIPVLEMQRDHTAAM